MTQIKFGTDGWRAVIDKDFTPENVARVIQAFCDVHQDGRNHLVYIGHDRRQWSPEMATLAAEILAANGFSVRLTSQFCPTPCVSWLVKDQKALAGIVITASHNPPDWNGIKFKDGFGAAASPEYTQKIEEQILVNEKMGKVPERGDLATLKRVGAIQSFDPGQTYLRHLKNFLRVDSIKNASFKIIYDPLFGAGTGFIGAALDGLGVSQIHDVADTRFGGLNPEPIERNLSALRERVLTEGADIGLATDGDADRIGAFSGDGQFVNSHQIFGLLLLHHVRFRKLRGAVVKSLSTTQLIDRICAKVGLPVIETPIGFKYISKELLQHDALMGGEESGGISLREHVHERDGVLNGLLLLEMMAINGKSLAGLLLDMDAEFGKFEFCRDDYHLTDAKIAQVKSELTRQPIQEVGGIAVKSINTKDGFKYLFADDAWLLIRASGTEPLLRVYAEAIGLPRVKQLLEFARARFM